MSDVEMSRKESLSRKDAAPQAVRPRRRSCRGRSCRDRTGCQHREAPRPGQRAVRGRGGGRRRRGGARGGAEVVTRARRRVHSGLGDGETRPQSVRPARRPDLIPAGVEDEERSVMSQVTAVGRGGGSADGVLRLSREERVARGRAARTEVPRSSHAEFAPAPDRPDPVALLETQAGAGYRSCCRSVTAGWRCRRSRSSGAPRCRWPPTWPHTPERAHGAGLRGRAPGELRHVRVARSGVWCSTSTTSTRPCPGRGSGTSSGWRRAWRWRRGPTTSRRRCAGHRAGVGGRLPRGDAGVRGYDRAGGLVRPRRHGRGAGEDRAAPGPSGRKALARSLAKARTKDNLGALSRFAGRPMANRGSSGTRR